MPKTEKNIKKNKTTRKVKNKLNKNILLIANGESILNNELGSNIDEYDCVVRFNDFNIENNETMIGSKINYWVLNENIFSNILENNYETIVNNKIILLLAINYDNSDYYNDLLQHIKNVSEKIIKEKSESYNKKPIIQIIPKKYSQYIQNNFDFNDFYPSSEFLTLIYFLNEFKNITLHGYDFKIANANNMSEKEIIYNLYGKKKFKFLVEPENSKNIFIEKYKQPIDESKNIDDYDINLAIVSCVKNPTNFKFWIDYHINKCNVKKIFLRVQDSPELVGLLENYRNIIEPTYVNNDSKFNSDYQDLQTIQGNYINTIIEKIKNDKHNILTHIAGNIDDDELLFLPNGLIPFYEELINNNSYGNYKVNNIEACYNNKTNNIFKSPYFCCNNYEFTSYCYGKSIGNLSQPIQAQEPHNFRDGSNTSNDKFNYGFLNTSNAIILHYESNCIKKWYNKYKSYSLNNTLNGSADPNIPFAFYKETINAFKDNIKNKEEIWERHKLAKYRDPNTLLKINIHDQANHINKIYLCKDPLIYIIDNFISPFDCDYIIEKFKNNLEDARVVSNREYVVNATDRNNISCWDHCMDNDIINNIRKKISELVNYSLENSEKLQIINYKPGQKYNAHHDGWFDDNSETSNHNLQLGQRMVTCLIYLNDVEEGGETEFPKLNLKVTPKKGRIVIFYNIHKDTDKLHDLSMHAGTNVIKGEKWACNLWFRNKIYNK
jgi:prolyl 4-hydroxylase